MPDAGLFSHESQSMAARRLAMAPAVGSPTCLTDRCSTIHDSGCNSGWRSALPFGSRLNGLGRTPGSGYVATVAIASLKTSRPTSICVALMQSGGQTRMPVSPQPSRSRPR